MGSAWRKKEGLKNSRRLKRKLPKTDLAIDLEEPSPYTLYTAKKELKSQDIIIGYLTITFDEREALTIYTNEGTLPTEVVLEGAFCTPSEQIPTRRG